MGDAIQITNTKTKGADMRKKTQVPARIIAECTTQEQKAEVEQKFAERYDWFKREAEDFEFGFELSCKELQDIAWESIEMDMFGAS